MLKSAEKSIADETPVAHRADLCDHARRMALGRRHDRFAARIDHAHRAIEQPGGERDEGLNREIELRAEPAADRGRDDAHLLGRDAQDLRDVVAIHIGRLRAGLDFDAVADAARKAGLGLDIGVLDKAGLERAFDHDVGRCEARFDIAARHAAGRQDVAGRGAGEYVQRPHRAPLRASSARAAGSRSRETSQDRDRASSRCRRRPARPPRRESARRLSASTGWSAKGAITP